MTGKSAYTIVPPPARAVQDEWGMFDPNQAGLTAAFRAVRALDEPSGGDRQVDAGDDHDDRAQPSASDEAPLRSASGEQPAAALSAVGRPVLDTRPDPRRTRAPRLVPSVVAPHDAIFDLTESDSATPPKPVERGAVYSLEFPTRCPQCCTEIQTVRVSRLLRTQVSFTSTLPRKGYIIVCPECDGILSAELSGLI